MSRQVTEGLDCDCHNIPPYVTVALYPQKSHWACRVVVTWKRVTRPYCDCHNPHYVTVALYPQKSHWACRVLAPKSVVTWKHGSTAMTQPPRLKTDGRRGDGTVRRAGGGR